jgi:polyhydroxyalkanoate synthase
LQAWEDWWFHLALSPGRQAELAWSWAERMSAIAKAAAGKDWAIKPDGADRRFRSEAWKTWPFNVLAQLHLAAEHQWQDATSDIRGVASHHARRVQFMGRFLLNALAPVNFAVSNPDVVHRSLSSAGANFAAGASLFAEDVLRLARNEKLKGMDHWRVGKTMAVSPGKVVFRNHLMELIQYEPTTATVRREPILIVPAWIMKFYILDLTPEDSLVRFLVAQGFTVFMISWKNPDRSFAQIGFEDYRRDGVMAAFDAIGQITPQQKIHAVGYCLGGTTLAIAAAAMDRDRDDRIKTLTLLAAQTDFEEAGELLLFIDESQLALLEDMMHVAGYLDARRMAGAFYALRANEMLFAKLVERYLLGEPSEPTALDAWLADPTRMPAKMHGEYLRKLFMENRFSHGDYEVGGKAVALKDIRVPIFALGAERDHIAPWRSVYKIELYGSAEKTFVLTGGGHNSSVISPPGKRGAYYWMSHSEAGGDYIDPDAWLDASPRQDGSWWPEWLKWLNSRSSPRRVRPPAMSASELSSSLADAPGEYVFES